MAGKTRASFAGMRVWLASKILLLARAGWGVRGGDRTREGNNIFVSRRGGNMKPVNKFNAFCRHRSFEQMKLILLCVRACVYFFHIEICTGSTSERASEQASAENLLSYSSRYHGLVLQPLYRRDCKIKRGTSTGAKKKITAATVYLEQFTRHFCSMIVVYDIILSRTDLQVYKYTMGRTHHYHVTSIAYRYILRVYLCISYNIFHEFTPASFTDQLCLHDTCSTANDIVQHYSSSALCLLARLTRHFC